MKNSLIFTVFALMLMSSTCLAQTGWITLATGTTSNLNTVHFESTGTGYIAGYNSIILKTTNNGNNWIDVSFGSLFTGNSVHFFDNSIGLIAGQTTGGAFLRTTNAGASWNLNMYYFGVMNIKSMSFTDIMNGYAVATPGYILKTVNSGVNWNSLYYVAGHLFETVYFLNVNTGFAFGLAVPMNSLILKTTNAGLNWNSIQNNFNYFFRDSYFINSETGYVTGNGFLMKTINGGLNWTVSNLGTSVYAVYFIGPNTGFAAGAGGSVYRTTNAGANWLFQQTNTIKDLNDIYFINEYEGYACGNDGTVIKTTTGGTTGFQSYGNSLPLNYYLYQNYPNPFNPVTIINYELPITNYVKLVIYNVLGKEIAVIVNQKQNAGKYEIEWDASDYPSGVYFYKLTAGEYADTKRMVLLK